MAGPLYGPQPSRQALARERLAQALLGQGMDASPIQHPLQGLARLAQAYFGSQMLRRGEEDERKREGDYASGLNAALLGATDSGMIADRLAGSGNPDLVRMAPQFRISQIETASQAARDKAKADAERALEEWKLKHDPSKRFKAVGNSLFDVSGDPTKPIWSQAEKPPAPPAAIEEYNFAKGQGFQGSFMDFQAAKAKAGMRSEAVWQIDPQNPLVQVNVQTGERKALPGAEKAQGQQEQAANAMADVDRMIASANDLLQHPGRKTATGKSSVFNFIPGTDAYGFQAKLNTLKAQVFLPEVQKMVGMGALSNAEGEKISAAFAALDPGMKEEEFEASLKGALSQMHAARQRFAQKVGKYSNMTDQQAITASQQGASPAGWSIQRVP